MNLGELKGEFFARGFDYLSADRAGLDRATRWLNEGYTRDVCDLEPWPFLEQTSSGAAPLALGNIKDVLYVVDTTNGNVLSSTDARDIAAFDPGQSTQGVPSSYVIDGVSTIRVYPVAPVQLLVRYIGTPAFLVADADVPLIPERFHNLIVDAAVVRAYRDSDNFEAAVALQQAMTADLAAMTDAMFSRNFDNTQFVQRVEPHEF